MSEGRKRSHSDTRDDGEPHLDSFAEPSDPKRSKVEESDDHENASSLVGSLVDPSNSSSAPPNESRNTLQHPPETTATITTPEELMKHFSRCIQDESDDAVKKILTTVRASLELRLSIGTPVLQEVLSIIESFRNALPPQFMSDLQKRMAQPFDYLRQFRSIKSTHIKQIVAEADFIAELNLKDMPEAEACFQMWEKLVAGKVTGQEVVPTVLNALNSIPLQPNASESHSRELISSVLRAIVNLDTELFKSRILDSAPSNSPGEESIDYVFLAQIRKDSNLLEIKSTAPSALGEIPDQIKVFGAGEAKRLLPKTARHALVALSQMIKEETGAEFKNSTGASDGNSTSGDLACALAQGASYFLGLPQNRRPPEYTYFVSNGLLWRFIVVREHKMLVSKCFLLAHKGLPSDCTERESNEAVVQYLSFMLFWVSMKAQAEAQFELFRKLPGVSPVFGDARRFIAMNEKNDCVQYTLEYFLGGGSQRLAFAARQFRLGQSAGIPWRLVKIDIDAHDGRAAWQSQTEIAVLRKLQGAPGIPTLLECGEFRAGHKYIITDVVGMKLTDFIRTYPSRASAVYWKGRVILEALWASGYVLSDINSSFMVVDHNEAVWFADLGGCYRASDPPIRQHRVITAAHATWKAFIGETPTPDDELLSYNALFSAHVLSADQCPSQSSAAAPYHGASASEVPGRHVVAFC